MEYPISDNVLEANMLGEVPDEYEGEVLLTKDDCQILYFVSPTEKSRKIWTKPIGVQYD